MAVLPGVLRRPRSLAELAPSCRRQRRPSLARSALPQKLVRGGMSPEMDVGARGRAAAVAVTGGARSLAPASTPALARSLRAAAEAG